MDIQRLKKIIVFSMDNRDEIERQVRDFYSFSGMNQGNDVLDIMQIVRPSLEKKGYLVFEMPFADREIGALCYKGEALGYVVLNTSLPKINVNFALCHELYHVFYPKHNDKTKVEFANDRYYEHEEEFSANVFAGILLMPKENFSVMYTKFLAQTGENLKATLVCLMNYYQVPYMAVLIRCLELGLLEEGEILQELLEVSTDEIRKYLAELWLDERILDASRRDDFVHMETLVKRIGAEYIKDHYLNERTLTKVLQNMKQLYEQIREKE